MKSFKGAYVNLLKTSIGSGVLNFPLLFRTYGILTAISLTIISGFFASVGLVLLAICANDIGRTADLSSLASISIPYARPAVDLAVFVKCFGVSLSYMIITKQLLPPFIESLFGPIEIIKKPWLTLLLFLLVTAPFTYYHKLDRMKYTSFLGVVCILIVVFLSIFRYFCYLVYPLSTAWIAPQTAWITTPNVGWLSGLGKFVFSFTCHQNIFAANSEMKNNSVKRLKTLIYSVASTAFFLYMGFGLSNYLTYGSAVKDNVINNYPPDYLSVLVRGMYIVVMGVSYPLQVIPARKYFMNMARLGNKSSNFKLVSVIVTTIILFSTYLIAISGIELGVVFSLVGATASTFMCLILPALYYLNMEIERTTMLVIFGYCAFLFGVLVFISTIFGIILKPTH